MPYSLSEKKKCIHRLDRLIIQSGLRFQYVKLRGKK